MEGESSGGWCERCWCGEFAGNARDSVIPLGWAQWAMERWRDVQLSGLPFGEVSGRRVFGVDVARSGNDECAIAIRQGDVVERIVTYRSNRSAAWWHLRGLLDPSRGSTPALPDDDLLLADLTTPRWSIANGSVIQVESKDALRQRLGRSCDRADSVISAYFVSGAVARFRAASAQPRRKRCQVGLVASGVPM